MDNQNSILEVSKSSFGDHFVKPLYDSYCFSRIPGTILSCLGLNSKDHPTLPVDVLPDVKTYQTVVLIFLDAFGWRYLDRYTKEVPISSLSEIRELGVTSKITAQFPSTTAAHVTSIHTGMPVYDSGVYEWYYYESRVGSVISPLLFSRAGDNGRDTLLDCGVAPKDFLPSCTLYDILKGANVSSYVFQHQDYAAGAYSQHVTSGASIKPFSDYREALSEISQLVTSAEQKQYIFFYYDQFDSQLHKVGVEHPAADQVAIDFFDNFYSCLLQNLKNIENDTLLLLTADHGMVDMDYRTTVYLDDIMPTLMSDVKQNKMGAPILPVGSSRDFFLHVKPANVGKVEDLLKESLSGRAEVFRVSDMIREGIFGQSSPTLEANLGDFAILPFEGESVFVRGDRSQYVQKFLAHHGGLTKNEMESIFIALDTAQL